MERERERLCRGWAVMSMMVRSLRPVMSARNMHCAQVDTSHGELTTILPTICLKENLKLYCQRGEIQCLFERNRIACLF